jgi:hypothetical protein
MKDFSSTEGHSQYILAFDVIFMGDKMKTASHDTRRGSAD